MTEVAVLGSKGQLGQSILYSVTKNEKEGFKFFSREDIDITKKTDLDNFFSKNHFRYCINCAAYTNVDGAEKNIEDAFLINSEGAKNIAEVCKKYNIVLIHISTDYVFDGESTTPYKTTDFTNPINQYGKSKLQGEQYIESILTNYYIIRTSWLYSEYGRNFVKTILRLASEKEELSVVNDQTGSPTYAGDLAHFIIHIIRHNKGLYGLYHFSNSGKTSWCTFAKKILELSNNTSTLIKPLRSKDFKTEAIRPKNSVLDNTKAINTFKFETLNWETSLKHNIDKFLY